MKKTVKPVLALSTVLAAYGTVYANNASGVSMDAARETAASQQTPPKSAVDKKEKKARGMKHKVTPNEK